METVPAQCVMNFSRPREDTLLVRISGDCKIGGELPSAADVQKQVESESRIRRVAFDTQDLTGWDSGFLTFLISVVDQCSQNQIHAETEGLPQGVQLIGPRYHEDLCLDAAEIIERQQGAFTPIDPRESSGKK